MFSGVGSDPRNLIINYIPTPVSEEELKQLFVQYGEVESARIILDRETGQPKGYGFVKFMSEESAQEAIRKMNGFEIHNKRLKVTTARGPAAMQRGGGGGSSSHGGGGSSHNNNNGGSSHHSNANNNNQYQNNNNGGQQHHGANNGGGSHGNNNSNFGVQQGGGQQQGMMMMGGDGTQPMMMYQPMPAPYMGGAAAAPAYMPGYPMMQPVMMMPPQMGMAGGAQYMPVGDAAALQAAYMQGLHMGQQQLQQPQQGQQQQQQQQQQRTSSGSRSS
jgi:RNA recognition motif-containing protein